MQKVLVRISVWMGIAFMGILLPFFLMGPPAAIAPQTKEAVTVYLYDGGQLIETHELSCEGSYRSNLRYEAQWIRFNTKDGTKIEWSGAHLIKTKKVKANKE